jgi:hypothetical protein
VDFQAVDAPEQPSPIIDLGERNVTRPATLVVEAALCDRGVAECEVSGQIVVIVASQGLNCQKTERSQVIQIIWLCDTVWYPRNGFLEVSGAFRYVEAFNQRSVEDCPYGSRLGTDSAQRHQQHVRWTLLAHGLAVPS